MRLAELLSCFVLLACGGPPLTPQNVTSQEELMAMGPLEPNPPIVWFDGQRGGEGMMNGRLLFSGATVYTQGSLRVAIGLTGAVATAPSFVGWIQASARCGSHWVFISDANVIAVSSTYLGALRVVGRAALAGMAPSFVEDGNRTLLHVARQGFEFSCEDEVVVRALPQRSILSATRGHETTAVVTTSASFARRDGSETWHRLDVGQDAVERAYATVNGLILATSRGPRVIREDFGLETVHAPGAHPGLLSRPSPQRREADLRAMLAALRHEGVVPSESLPGPDGSVVYCTPDGPEVRFGGGGTFTLQTDGCWLSGFGPHLSFRAGTEVHQLKIDTGSSTASSELLFTLPVHSKGADWLGGALYRVSFDEGSPCGNDDCIYNHGAEPYYSPFPNVDFVATPNGPLFRRTPQWSFWDVRTAEETALPSSFGNPPVVGIDGSIWTHRESEDGSLSDLLLLRGDEVLRRPLPEGTHHYAVHDRSRLFARDRDGREFWRSTDGGLHWNRLDTDPRVNGLFRAGPASSRRGHACGDPCFWSSVMVGQSPLAYPDDVIIGSAPLTPLARPHTSAEHIVCESLETFALDGAPTSLLSRHHQRASWHGVDHDGVFHSHARRLRGTSAQPDEPIWLHRDTALTRVGHSGASLRWLRRGGQEKELVAWSMKIDAILLPGGSGAALSEDHSLAGRRAFAWNEDGTVAIERFFNRVGHYSVAWVGGHPAVLFTDDPWGDRLVGDIIFLDASRESQAVDLEIGRTLCSDDNEGGGVDLFSMPGAYRWGLTQAILEPRGGSTCLRAARGGPEGDPWNAWVSDSSLSALVAFDRIPRLRFTPAPSQTEPVPGSFGRLYQREIIRGCLADEDLAGSGTLVLAESRRPVWRGTTFSAEFRNCVVRQRHSLSFERADPIHMRLTVVAASANLRPSRCAF